MTPKEVADAEKYRHMFMSRINTIRNTSQNVSIRRLCDYARVLIGNARAEQFQQFIGGSNGKK